MHDKADFVVGDSVFLLLYHCVLVLPFCVKFFGGSLFCNLMLSVLSCFAIIVLKKKELVALLKWCCCFQVATCVLCLFLGEPWVSQWMIVAFNFKVPCFVLTISLIQLLLCQLLT